MEDPLVMMDKKEAEKSLPKTTCESLGIPPVLSLPKKVTWWQTFLIKKSHDGRLVLKQMKIQIMQKWSMCMKQKEKFIKTQEIINSLLLKLVPQFFCFRQIKFQLQQRQRYLTNAFILYKN